MSACIAGDLGSIPGLGRSPGGGQLTPVFLPGESGGQRSLAGYSPWGCKELEMTERLHFTIVIIKLLKLLILRNNISDVRENVLKRMHFM